MSHIYLDNAATTPIDKAVIEAMIPMMEINFGNPSSIHSHGRTVRSAIEKSRKTIAELLSTSPAEIFFTSGGTEADNTAIYGAIDAYKLTHAITSQVEHHAVLHTLEHLSKLGKIQLSFVNLDENGNVDLSHLEELLQNNPRTLVSLMHGNNEIGNLLNLEKTGEICRKYNAIFHSDTVQTMGHFRHDLKTIPIDFIVGAGHKFHGPKGVGFLYINADSKISPFIHGGAQERNMRGGTENIYGIVGIAKALEIAYAEMDEHRKYIENIKTHMITRLSTEFSGIDFNGNSADLSSSLYTVLSVNFPESKEADMFLFNLDINKISASGGSACASGSNIGSHVLTAIGGNPNRPSVRFSFSKYNTITEIDYVIEKLKKII
jgi:cysteine desulfurase